MDESQNIALNKTAQQSNGAQSQPKQEFQAPKKENSGKGKRVLAILLVIILLIGTAAGAWYYGTSQAEKEAQARIAELENSNDKAPAIPFYENTTEVPSDWKKYTSPKYGISFSHPESTVVNEVVVSKKDGDQNVYSENADEVIVIGVAGPDEQQSRYQINIQKQTLNDTIRQLKSYYEGPGKFEGSVSYATYQYQGGYQLVEVTTNQDSIGTTKSYFTYKNGYTYALGEVTELRNKQGIDSKESLIIFESIIVE